MKKLGYSDFIRICQIEQVDTWCGWLSLREDGVYVKKPDDEIWLTPEERAVLTEHPTGNLNEPALSFPCNLSSLMAFLEEQSIGVDIDDAYLSSVGYQEGATSESTTRHKLQNRVRFLHAEVQTAKRRALDSEDPGSVWAELIKMAEKQEGLFIGQSSDGLQYKGKKYQDTGTPDVFTSNALRDRMRRAKRR